MATLDYGSKARSLLNVAEYRQPRSKLPNWTNVYYPLIKPTGYVSRRISTIIYINFGWCSFVVQLEMSPLYTWQCSRQLPMWYFKMTFLTAFGRFPIAHRKSSLLVRCYFFFQITDNNILRRFFFDKVGFCYEVSLLFSVYLNSTGRTHFKCVSFTSLHFQALRVLNSCGC